MFVNKIKFFSALSEMLFTYKESNFNIRMKNVSILQAISGICYVIARGVIIEWTPSICYVIARGVTIEWTPSTIFSWLG